MKVMQVPTTAGSPYDIPLCQQTIQVFSGVHVQSFFFPFWFIQLFAQMHLDSCNFVCECSHLLKDFFFLHKTICHVMEGFCRLMLLLTKNGRETFGLLFIQ